MWGLEVFGNVIKDLLCTIKKKKGNRASIIVTEKYLVHFATIKAVVVSIS